MTSALLEVEGLTAGYGNITVIRDVSIRVAEHEGVALLGPNGHGKTTLLRTLSGLERASSGTVLFEGRPLQNLSPRDIVGRGLVHVPQGNRLFPDCTVQENLDLGAFHRVRWRRRASSRQKVFDLFPVLGERRTQPCRTLSGGERQMLAVGMGLMAGPRLLILDEPGLGLSPKVKKDLRSAIRVIRDSGVAILLVEGDQDLVYSLIERWYLVELGRIAMEGDVNERLGREEMVARYFGVTK